MYKVVIDCDPGHDDVFAIGLAAKHLDVVGITTVCGNSTLENTTRNALIARELFLTEFVPVVSGANVPINGVEPRFTTAHGVSGLDGPSSRIPAMEKDQGVAHEFLIDQSFLHDGLWVIAIGPLTNVALACRKDSDFAKRIAGVSVMGGSASFGNVTSAAEYNTWFDPNAADEVFRSGCRLKMCGLDLTHQLGIGPKFGEALREIGSDASIFCAELFDYYFAYAESIFRENSVSTKEVLAPLHDPCAVFALTHPEFFESKDVSIQVETTGLVTKGMTVVDQRPWTISRDTNVELMTAINSERAIEVLVDSFR